MSTYLKLFCLLLIAICISSEVNSHPVGCNHEIEIPDGGLSRQKRQCTCTDSNHDHNEPKRESVFDVNDRQSMIGQKVTWVDNDNHKFSTQHQIAKTAGPQGVLTHGHAADYSHKPSSSNLHVQSESARGLGTQVKASGQYNFAETADHRGRVGIAGEYERHLNGPPGTGDPNYSVMLKASYDLP